MDDTGTRPLALTSTMGSLRIAQSMQQAATLPRNDDSLSKVVNQERQSLATLRNRSKKAVDGTDHVTDNARHIVESVDEQRIQVERLEDPSDDIDKVA